MFHCSVVYIVTFAHFCCMLENYEPMKKVTAIYETYKHNLVSIRTEYSQKSLQNGKN